MKWLYLRACPWMIPVPGLSPARRMEGRCCTGVRWPAKRWATWDKLRPDLRFFATDLVGAPRIIPPAASSNGRICSGTGCLGQRVRWDAVTCLHLVEHLHDLTLLLQKTARLLKPGGRIYFETPHPKTLTLSSLHGSAVGTFPMNFRDDLTTCGWSRWDRWPTTCAGWLEIVASGISRSWPLAAAYPLFVFLPASRQKFTARLHWLGWSAYLIARRPL